MSAASPETFLDLAQDLAIEAGVSGSGTIPVSVVGQIGEAARIVRWTGAAYEDIQNKRVDWDFLLDDFSFPTTLGVQSYLPSSVTPALTEHQNWKKDSFRCYLTATGLVDEQPMEFKEYDVFRDQYLYSANRTVPGRPTYFTIHPRTMAIITFPIANAAYTIAGEYFKRAHVLVADADEPLFPRQWRRIITWRALMYYGAFEGAPEVYAHGQAEYLKIAVPLGVDQGPEITTGGPLV